MTPASLPLVVACGLFAVGLAGLLLRRNLLVMLMCAELMVGGALLALLAFASGQGLARGQGLALFVVGVEAAELAVGLALVTAWNRVRGGADVDMASALGDTETPAEGKGD